MAIQASASQAGGDKMSTHVQTAAGCSAQSIHPRTPADCCLTFKCVPAKINHMLGHSAGHRMVYDFLNVRNVAQ